MPMPQAKAASVAAVVVGFIAAFAAAFVRQRHRRSTRLSSSSSSTTTKPYQISIVGDAFCDVVVGGITHLPEWGTDALTDAPIDLTPGGSASNSVLQLASLLRLLPLRSPSSSAIPNIILHTALGNDFFGSFMRGKIAQAAQGQDVRVSTASSSSSPSSPPLSSASSLPSSFSSSTEETPTKSKTTSTSTSTNPSPPPSIPPPTTRTTGVCICLSGAADRAFITHRGVVATFNVNQLDLPFLYNSRFVHIAGFYNCPSLWPALPGVLRECKQRGIFTSLSPQYDASGEWGGGLEEIFPWLDLFLPNEMEALAIWEGMRRREGGRKGEEEEGKEGGVEEAARYFVERGVRHVIVTRGPRGAYALVEEGGREGGREGGKRKMREVWQVCPRKEVVDTTGAGDSFNAGVLYRLVEGLMRREEGGREGGGEEEEEDVWREVLRMGCAMGSHSVTKVGASAPPRDREEIVNNLKEIQ